MLNERSILLTLQSFARAYLLRREPAMAIPLPGLSDADFSDASWKSLGLNAEEAVGLERQLTVMFPGKTDRANLAGLAERAASPGECAGRVYQAWLALSPRERTVVYESSGSSGLPKRLAHPYEAIVQEVDCVAGFFPGIRQVIGVTPQHHCFGFIFGILLHQRLGATYRALPSLPTIVRHALAPDTLFVGYPDLWNRLRPEEIKAPENLVCLSAGSPWPEENMQRMLDNGFGVLEIYGSSENGAIGRRGGPGDFTLLDYWRREADDEGQEGLSRALPSGKIIRCPRQDVLAWADERRFRPLKRLDSAVQVSGINVYPARVARFLAEHPQVRDARVRLMRQEEGCRLKAFIVPATENADPKTLRRELKKMCKSGLSAPERPVSFTFGPSLPRGEFGKDADWPV